MNEARMDGGMPLPESERRFFEPRFGQDVFFGKGEHQPGTNEGRRLTAHELAHTIQQNQGISRKVQRQIAPGKAPAKLQSYVDKNPEHDAWILSDPTVQATTEYASFLKHPLGIEEATYATRLMLADMRQGINASTSDRKKNYALQAEQALAWHDHEQKKGIDDRPLTPVEMAEARKVFGDLIDYKAVRINQNALFSWSSAYVTGNTINYPRRIKTRPGNQSMGILIHELTHVAQYQLVGVRYAPQAIGAQISALVRIGYNYQPGELQTKNFKGFNREQQAEIATHYYFLINGYPMADGFTLQEQMALYLPRIRELRRGEI